MTSPLLALRAAIRARLLGDAALALLMGGAVRLYDEPPRAAPVYALFGHSEARDDSVDGAQRHAHTLALVVHGKPGSARSSLEAAERIAALLNQAAPILDGHALVLLRVQAIAAQRDERSGESRATLTLQAVTETVP